MFNYCLTLNLNFMKVSNFVSSALLSSVLTVSTVFGNVNPNAKTGENSVRDQIESSLTEIADVNHGEVYVYFKASPVLGFELLNVSGADLTLVNKVKNQLAKGSISIPKTMEGSYYLKVIFADSKNVVKSVSPEELLRDAISEALAKVDVANGSVTLFFSVKGDKLDVKKVEGSDNALVSIVKNTIDKSAVSNLPAGITGKNYQINVKF
jgi:hypothetical protein